MRARRPAATPSRTRRFHALAGAVAVALTVASCATPSGAPVTSLSASRPAAMDCPRPWPTPTVPGPAAALAQLATLAVKGRAPKTGYSRDQFGAGWLDPDRNGRDARNDVLARDLTDTTLDQQCRVTAGALADPYTGQHIAFQRGTTTSDDVQIDHVVALSNAWQTGAQDLDPAVRQALANDPDNLQATDGSTNQAKSDADAATWLPPNRSMWCWYVARQVAVKARYGLWLTPAERDAAARVLGTCPT